MNETFTDSLGSIRTEAAPRRTITAYKLMRLVDGKLYPLYIDRSEPVELGVWYNADSVSKVTLESLPFGYHLIDLRSERVIESRQRKPSLDQVKRATAHNWRWFYVVQQKTKIGYKNVGIAESNGEETVKADFALRPGWHCGSLPVMNQIGKGPNRNLRDDSFVWTEIEISADIDYNDEAKANGGELYYIPHSGYYEKCTNANKAAAQADKMSWYIAGAIRINRIISDSEARQIIDRYNRQHRTNIKYDYPRESGKMFNADTMSLEGLDGRRYYGGNSGYQGYSKSNRAVDAEKRGLRSKSQMDNAFADKVNELIKAENPAAKKVTLAQIKKHLDNITADEWHHTSKFGNRTNYYSVERVANHFIDNIKIADATPISLVAKEDIDKILDYLQDSTCNDGKGRYLASNGVVVDVHRGEPPFSRAYNEGSIETRYISRYVEPYELDEPQRSMLVDALAEANNRRKMIVEAERTKSLFNESAAYERVRVAIVGGGLQGTKKAPKKQTDSWYIDKLRHKFFMQLVTKARVKVEVAQELSLMAVDAMVEFGQWKNRQYESPENTTDRLKAHEILCRITDKLLDKRIIAKVDAALAIGDMIRDCLLDFAKWKDKQHDKGLQGTKKTATALTVTVFKFKAVKTPPQTFKRRSTTTKSRLVSYTVSGTMMGTNINNTINRAKLLEVIRTFNSDKAEDFITEIGKCFPQQVERERRIDEHNKQAGYEEIKKPKSKYQLIDFSEFGVKILFRVSDHNIDSDNIEDDIEEAYSLAFKSKNSPNTFKANDVTVTEYVFLTENCDRDKYRRIAQNILNFLDTSEWNEDFVKHDFKNPDDKKPLSGTISPDQLALFGDEPQPKQSHYGLLFDETDAKWNLTAEDIALIDELQKEYSEQITANEPERNRRNAQLAYCLIKFLKGESDAVTKNLSSSWYLTNRAYINPEYARYEYIADYLYHNPITRNIVRKYVPDLKGMSGSIKKMFEFLIELYKQRKADTAQPTAEPQPAPTAEPQPEPSQDKPQNASDTYRFAEELAKLYADGEKLDLSKAKAINRQNGYNFTTNQLMQACELAVVIRATQIAKGPERPTTLKEKYDALVDLYSRQVTIQPKDSRATSLQQYSTPAPLAFLLGCFVDNWLRPNATRNYFEPTAGNGLLTIALDHSLTTVNELDDVRFHNLQQIGYQHCYNEDICNPSKDAYMLGINKEFAGVIMNPPFDKLDKNDFLTRKATIEGREATYTFERLDHKIAILSLEKMRDDGRAAIIIGGKMAVKLGDWKESYWKNGAIFGQYRTFITYLHRQYNIVDILYINGDLYRKQGTTFPIVAILIDGRTEWNDSREHQWHKFDEMRDNQIDTFNELYLRLEKFAVNPDREANVANYRRLYEPQKADAPDRKRAQALLMLAKAKIKIAQAQQAQRMKQ